MFGVEFSSQAKKFLKKSDKTLAKRLIDKIKKLREDPFPSDVKRVENQKDKVFRVRVGDFRIQYSVLYKDNLIFVTSIDKRPRAY
jgi:mRNA interferase RelE/StbE